MPAPPPFLDAVDVRMPEPVGRGRGGREGWGCELSTFFCGGCGPGRFMMAGCRLGSGGGGKGVEGFLTRFGEWRALSRDSAEYIRQSARHQGALFANYKAQVVLLWDFNAVEEVIRMILILDTDYNRIP